MDGSNRHYQIDWLRALAMLTVFFFHCARFFDHGGWHVKNNHLSFGLSVFVGIVAQWIMPLFFVISGISSRLALARRRSGQYVSERFKRLFIPLVFGIFVLIPPQVYIERVTKAGFSGSFLDFLPRYFDGFYAFEGNFAWMGLHLWYLEVLFLFSLLTLPLFSAIKKGGNGGILALIAGLCDLPGGIFLFAIPLAVTEMLVNLQPKGIGMREFGGWSLVPYLVFFIYGYLIASDERIERSVERQCLPALALAVAATTAGFVLIQHGYSSYSPSLSTLRAFNSWFWLVAILGLTERFLRLDGRIPPYTNEAVLPFYILHQTVIVIIGYSIMYRQAGVAAKYLFLSAASFIIIMGLYELLIRRFAALRFLFGMRGKNRGVGYASQRVT